MALRHGWATGAADASRLDVGEQGVTDGREESRNGNRIVLDRKVSGRQQGVASWMGQGASKIVFGEKVRGKQQGIAARVVVDENAMGRTSRDMCWSVCCRLELQRCGSCGIPRRTRLASDRVV